MNDTADTTLMELIVGIVFYCVMVQIVLLIISDGLLPNSIGLWIGGITACGMSVHMKRSIEDALDLGEAGALAHIRKSFTLRTVVVAIIFGITFYFHISNVITTFIGVMGLKISAYIQPYVRKGMNRFKKSK